MRRLNKKKFRRFLSVVFLVIIVVFGLVWFNIDRAFSGDGDPSGDKPGGIILDIPDLDKRISILLIGADQRSGDTSFNTDTIIVASIDPESKRISLLSIPRDTMVSLPGSPYLKINSVVMLTDFETLKEKVTELTGIPLSGYVLTNFQGFKDIIDTLDGIEIDVEKDMYYETGDKEDGFIDLEKGLQTLDGAKALQYARFRRDALADISRTQRQQKVLKAVADKMLKLSTIPKLPWLIPQINKAVQTDLSLTEMFKLAKAAAGFNSENVISQTLPGGFKDIDGISYWEVFPDNAKKVVEDLFKGIASSDIKDVIDHVNLPDPQKPQDPLVVPGGPTDPNGQESPGHEESSAPTDNLGGTDNSGKVDNSSEADNPPEAGNPAEGGNSGKTKPPDGLKPPATTTPPEETPPPAEIKPPVGTNPTAETKTENHPLENTTNQETSNTAPSNS